ncbi:Putative cytochrome c SoxX protein (modular protein) [Candidatus Filomicrobium marinum]|uniref:Putative cytochrome c SoxX protein (Modular protein) n=1 Tax=Candidatus Filomicrobium marinum TaxID=1608628 RepID=A0A0D6JAU9_9HYPH|nr:sulfur oxidation c-type cytochrome SoxX [Candidatus Filomicrobium marinum]CFX03596.1 Putative cytochrome c SoxX protein (modular protein) [Candidatus Filomicrobium marinum]CPR15884.1 Putative cytochrome c SoxX protein (modular protein) [Candidatus Filomicrobium marinum]
MVKSRLTSLWLAAALVAATPVFGHEVVSYEIVGDAVPMALGGRVGDRQRGKVIVFDRRRGNCLICHTFPVANEPFQGDLGPALGDVGKRLSEGQIRLRLIDPLRLNPKSLMPAYYKVDGLREVAPEYQGKPALEAQEIEDVTAYLVSLKGQQ